jgi:hypothetical protein
MIGMGWIANMALSHRHLPLSYLSLFFAFVLVGLFDPLRSLFGALVFLGAAGW